MLSFKEMIAQLLACLNTLTTNKISNLIAIELNRQKALDAYSEQCKRLTYWKSRYECNNNAFYS